MLLLITKIVGILSNRIKILRKPMRVFRDKLILSYISKIVKSNKIKIDYDIKNDYKKACKYICIYWAQGLESAPLIVQ